MINKALEKFIRQMPKIELHVHLEGSIRPETLLQLADRNGVALPVDSLEGLREWVQFKDFPHFIEVYFAICDCLCTPEDFETITAEFSKDRDRQNIRYSEVTFTPYTHVEKVSFDDQLAAINRAQREAEAKYGVRMGLVPDISRHMRPVEESYRVADWAAANQGNGVVAFGLGGPEVGNPPELFCAAFERAAAAGLPAVPHAGETEGPASIWGALQALNAVRLGHGVRCLEDPELVQYIREKQIPLEVCPSSNVCLGVVSSLEDHPLPMLLAESLYVTINSDDPPLFDTTLTDEYLRIAETFGYRVPQLKQFVLNAVRASFLPPAEKLGLESDFEQQFEALEQECFG